jgi:hypothetical protein
MRKFTIITLIVAALASGAYTGFWFFTANHLKKEVAEFLTIDSPELLLKHEGIVCKGFPFTVEMAVKNPVITYKAGDAISNELSTDGNWIIGGTILGTRGWIEVSGKTTFETFEPHSLNCKLGGTLRWEIPEPIKYLEMMRRFQKESADQMSEEIEKLFNDVSISGEELSFVWGSNDEPFITIDSLKSNWEKIQTTAPYSLGQQLKLDLQGYDIHQKQLAELLNVLNDPNSWAWWVQDKKGTGKNDLCLHLRMQMSTEENVFPFSIEVEKLTVSNGLSHSSIKAKFELDHLQPQWYAGAFSFKCVQEISDQSHDYVVSCYQAVAKKFQELGYFAEYPKWENLFINHWDQVATLIPDYANLGSTETEIDLSFQTKREDENQVEDWSCDLKKCAIRTAACEIALKGYKGFRDSGEASFLEVQIPNYQKFIQSLASYYNRCQSVLTSTQTVSEMEMPPVNDKAVDRIATFLGSLSQSPKDRANDLHIVVQGNNAEDMIIGPLNSERFSSAFSQFIVDVTTEMYLPLIPQATKANF